MPLTDAVEDIGIVCGETKFFSSLHLIPGENRQAVDRLDSCVDKPLVGRDSATSAQPASRWGSRATINPPNYPHVIGKGHGVDDGFRTRDLRIHNPAL